MLRAPGLRGGARSEASSTPAMNGESGAEECPGEEAEAPDPTVVAKLDAEAPDRRHAERRSRPPGHDAARRSTPAAATSTSTTATSVAAFSSAGRPDPALWRRRARARAQRHRGRRRRAARCSSPIRSDDRSRCSGPKKRRRPSRSTASLRRTSRRLEPSCAPRSTRAASRREYHFQYGTSDCAERPRRLHGRCPRRSIPAGFGDRRSERRSRGPRARHRLLLPR